MDVLKIDVQKCLQETIARFDLVELLQLIVLDIHDPTQLIECQHIVLINLRFGEEHCQRVLVAASQEVITDYAIQKLLPQNKRKLLLLFFKHLLLNMICAATNLKLIQ